MTSPTSQTSTVRPRTRTINLRDLHINLENLRDHPVGLPIRHSKPGWKGEPTTVYFASQRMYDLFTEWLNQDLDDVELVETSLDGANEAA